jgi:hypothetical protein
MFYDDEEDDDIDIYEDDEYEGEDEEDDEEDEDEETLRELEVGDDGHVVEGRRKRRRAGGYDESFEDTHPEAFGYED